MRKKPKPTQQQIRVRSDGRFCSSFIDTKGKRHFIYGSSLTELKERERYWKDESR